MAHKLHHLGHCCCVDLCIITSEQTGEHCSCVINNGNGNIRDCTPQRQRTHPHFLLSTSPHLYFTLGELQPSVIAMVSVIVSAISVQISHSLHLPLSSSPALHLTRILSSEPLSYQQRFSSSSPSSSDHRSTQVDESTTSAYTKPR